MPDASQGEFPDVWILELAHSPSSTAREDAPRIFGLSSIERLERTLTRIGAKNVRRVDSNPTPSNLDPVRVVLLRSDHVYDERLVQELMRAEGILLSTPATDGQVGEPIAANVSGERAAETADFFLSPAADGTRTPPSGITKCEPTDLVPPYNPQLRKFDPPFLFEARADIVRQVEDRVFAASYKGITDFITKHVFPRPALAVVRMLANRGVHPNTVTFWSYVLTVLVTLAFAWGWFGVGLLAAWLMTFLDTVDGKLARVTLTSSQLGGFLDHALDLVHPPIWWWAWAVGVGLGVPGVEFSLWIVVGGYILGRVLEGIFLALFKMEMFTWRPFDAHFRAVIARRNPNLLLLSIGLIFGRPDWGYIAVAVWTLLCLVIAGVRIGQAAAMRLRGQPIQPWHEESVTKASPAMSNASEGHS